MYSKTIRTAIAMAGMAIMPVMGHATVLNPGVYEAYDIAWASESPIERSIWTSPNMVTGGSANNLWSFVSAIFSFNGTNATLSGSAENTGNTGLTFDFEFNFTNAVNGAITDAGYCQFDGSPGTCNAGDGFGASQWTYFEFDGGSATGTGSIMSGVNYTFEEDAGGGHPPQAGYEANALVHNGLLGFSMWFDWERESGSPTSAPGGYTFNANGNGDINTNLTPVPVPAAGLLLLTAFGGLAAMRRRKQKAV